MRNVLILLVFCLSFIKLSAQVNVIATGGAATGTYSTVGTAFAAINAGTHTGDITLNISANTTEAGPCVLNGSGAGSASYTSVIIQPSVDGVIISGPTATGRGLIELNGASNVTINGDNPGSTGINRNLTITNTAANTITITSVIRIALSTLVISANNVTVKNCNLNGSGTGRNVSTATTEVATYAIVASAGASTVSATAAPSALVSGSTLVSAPLSVSNLLIDNNNIQTASRAISINGGSLDVADGLVISNNIIGNPTVGAANQVTSIGITAQGANNGLITGNTVRVENYLNATNLNRGIDIGTINPGGPGNFTIEKNKVSVIDNFTATSTATNAYGINCQLASTSTIIRNNFIGECVTGVNGGNSFVTTSGGTFGIRLAAGTGYEVYHNTVSFSNTFSGTAGSNLTACFCLTANTITNCDIRNNIFSNRHSGGNLASCAYACIYLPSGGTSAMGLIMNNNALFQGATSANAIAQVGTTVGTGVYSAINFYSYGVSPASNMRVYTSTLNTTTSNDTATLVYVSAPPFTSSTDFHIPAGTSTSLESAGASLGVTTDIDGDTRPGPAGSIYGGGVAPDLGADEFDGTQMHGVPPAITYTPLTGSCNTGDASLSATISDTTGIPTSGAYMPRIYFKKNSGTWNSSAGTLTSGTSVNGVWTFTISATAMGGLSGLDTVSYAVIAQDADVPPNVSSNPWPGLVASDVNTVTTPPVSVNSYTVTPTLTGTYTVGSGGSYPTLTAAVNAYNSSCLGGNVTFLLTNTSYSAGETFPIIIKNNPYAGPSATLTIKPQTGTAVTVTSSAATAAVIKLLNAQYVTIDGVNSGGSSLALNNGNTGINTAVVWLSSSATAGSGNKKISLLNMNMTGGAGSASNWGIISCIDGGTPSTTGGMDNDTVTIQGNTIKRCGYAVFAWGTAATSAGGLDNWIIRNNIFGSPTYSTTDIIGYNGVFMQYMVNPVLSGNTIRFVGLTTIAGQSTGVYMQGGISGAVLDSNTIDSVQANFTSGGTSSVVGIYLGTTVLNTTVSRNKILSIYNYGSGGARGITINTGSAVSNTTLVNNFVSDIVSSSSATTANWPTGIAIDGTGTGGINVYYNSVNLYGTHTGASAATGSACFYVNSTATGGNLDIRDNLFVNTYDNTTVTTDKSYSIYSLAANTVFSNIDYNDYFVSGVPGTLGYIGATARLSLSDIISGFGGNMHSVNGAVPFLSSTDLHVTTGSMTVVESAATPISGVITDIDNQVRPGPAGSIYGGATAPDIGADEYDGIPEDVTGPAITYSVLSTATCGTGDRTIAGVMISDASGVPTTGSFMPRIYFRKNSGSWYSAAGTLTSGTSTSGTWSFTISSATMGGVTAPDVVSYYVIAQDIVTIPNLSADPGTGLVASDVNTVTTAPTTPNTYTITPTLSGTYTVGSGGSYSTLTAAVNTYNTACLAGNVTFLLTDPSYSTSETFPIIIGNNPNAGPSATLTIKPQPGVAVTVTGTTTVAAVVKLLNAQYVTIDGVNSGGSSLTINDGNTTGTSSSAVTWLASTASTGPGNKNISLLNMNMIGGGNSATKWAIVACADGAAPAVTNGKDNDSVTVQGNTVIRCGYPLMAVGTASVSAGGLDGWVVKNNVFGPPTYSATDNIGNGLYLLNMVSPVITGNTVRQVGSITSTVNCLAIALRSGISGATVDSNSVDSVLTNSTGAGTSSASGIYLGSNVINTTVSRNKISAIYNVNTAGYGARGITVITATATSNVTVVNNFISDIFSYAGVPVAGWPMGIAIDGTGTGGVNVYYNSVNLYGNHTGASSTTGSACFYVSLVATGGNLDVRNNLFVNTYDNTSSTTDASYAIFSVAPYTVFYNIDHNDYYVSGTPGVLGYIGTNRPSLASIVTGFGGNANSVSGAVPFVSSTDLHVPAGSATVLESAAAPIAAVGVDIDNQARPGPAGSVYGGGTIPDIGADEFDGVPVDVTGPSIAYPALSTSVCGTGDQTITGVSISDFTGVPVTGSYVPRIYFSKNSGAWYSTAGSMTSGTTTSSIWSFTISATAMGGLTAGDVVAYYIIAQDIVSTPNVSAVPGAGLVATDVNTVSTPPTVPNTFVVNLLPSPIEGVSSVCNGMTITLSDPDAGGTWFSSNTAAATIGSATGIVNAVTPDTSTILYTFTYSGCSATMVVTVNPFPTGVTASATPISVCEGSNLTLTGSATGATTYAWTGPGGTGITAPTLLSTDVTGVTSGNAGVYTLTAAFGSCSVTTTTSAVTVNASPSAISGALLISMTNVTSLSDADPGGSWSSTNISVGTVDVTGDVTGLSMGTTTISYVFVSGCGSSAVVTVNGLPPALGNVPVCEGGSMITLSDAVTGGTWSSSDPLYATVGLSSGVVTGVTAGTATIIYTWGTNTTSVTVTVNPLPAPILGSSSMCVTGTITLSDVVTSGTWTSSMGSVAMIDATSGVVIPVATGLTTITYTGVNGCSTSIIVTVNGAISAAPTYGSPICAGGAATLLANPGPGSGLVYSWSGPGLSSTTDQNPTATPTVTSTYSLQVTATGCSASPVYTTMVTVNQLPASITASVNPDPVCLGNTVNLTSTISGGTGYTLLWTGGSSTINSNTSSSANITSAASADAGIYTLTATAPGCPGSIVATTAVLSVNQLPASVTASVSPGAICAGGTVNFNGIVSGGSGYSLLWTGGVSTIIGSTSAVASISSVATGDIGTYTLTATAAGCAGSVLGVTAALSIAQLPASMTASVGPDPVCLGNTINLTSTISGGASYTLLWTGGSSTINSNTSSSANITSAASADAGIYTLTATAPGCPGSIVATTAVLSVNQLPASVTASAAPGLTCAGSTLNLNGSVSGGSGYTLLWTGGSSTIGGATSTTAGIGSVVPGDAGVYTLTATAGGCGSIASITGIVTVNQLPTAIAPLASPNPACTGALISLQGNPTSGHGAIFSWSGPAVIDSPSAVNTTITSATIANSGTYTLIVTAAGCSGNIVNTVNVTVSVLPTVYNVSGGGGYCLGSSSADVILSGSETGVTYDLTNTGTSSVVSLPGTGASLNFGPQTVVGTITIIAIRDLTPCVSVMTGNPVISVNPTPSVYNVTGGGTICAGASGFAIGLDGSQAGFSYKLYNGATLDTTVAGTGFALSFGLEAVAGSYTVRAVSGLGCIAAMSGSGAVVVHALPTIFSMTGGGNYCAGGAGMPIGLSGSDTGINYTLYSGSVSVDTLTGTSTALSFGLRTVGSYTISAYNNITGCVNNMSGTRIITMSALPAIYNVTGGGSYCAGGSGVPVGLSGSDTGVSYRLYRGASLVDSVHGTGLAPSFGVFSVAGSYKANAINTTTGCMSSMSDSATISIITPVVPSVNVLAGTGDTVCAGTSVTYTATPTNGGSSPAYEWFVNGTSVGGGTNTYSYIPANGDIVKTVLISSAVCAIPDSVATVHTMVVNAHLVPSVTIAATPGTNVCMGTAVSYSAIPSNGGPAPAFSWFKNGSFLASGPTYSYTPADADSVSVVMISDYACRLEDSAHADVIMHVGAAVTPIVVISASPGLDIATGQQDTLSATVTNLSIPMSYQWIVNSTIITGATTNTYVSTFNNGDSVTCTAVASNGCNLEGFNFVKIHVYSVGVNGLTFKDSEIRLMPNPNKGTFTVKGSLGRSDDVEIKMEVTDLLGQVVYSVTATARNGIINQPVRLSNTLPNGVYIMSLRTENDSKVFHFVLEQ